MIFFSKTFVPSETMRVNCGDRGCNYAFRVPPEDETPYDAKDETPDEFLSPHRGYNTSHYYQELPNIAQIGSDSDDYDSDDSETSTLAVGAGLLLGATAVIVGFYFWRRGAFRRFQDRLTHSSIGSQLRRTAFGEIRYPVTAI